MVGNSASRQASCWGWHGFYALGSLGTSLPACPDTSLSWYLGPKVQTVERPGRYVQRLDMYEIERSLISAAMRPAEVHKPHGVLLIVGMSSRRVI